MSTPDFRLLFIDIETRPLLGYLWGTGEQHVGVDQIVEPTSVLCFAASWYGEKKPMYYEAREPNGPAFKAMIRKAHELLSEADAVCHFNGTSFDIKRLNTQFFRHGMLPPPRIPQIDLYLESRKNFGTDSGKLAFLAPFFGIGKKIENAGWALWKGCVDGDPRRWREMRDYCLGDADLLPDFYTKLRPWIENHPNMNLFVSEKDPVCPVCASKKIIWKGYRKTVTNIYKRYVCKSCGYWGRSRTAERGIKVAIR